MPVTSFAPEFLELYRKAAQHQVVLTLPSKADAYRLRARLHALRRALRVENHTLATVSNGVQISVYPSPEDDGTWKVSAHPSDTTYLDALHEAGITIPDPGLEESFAPDVVLPSDTSAQDDVLEKFFRGENKS
jgi:hypothetical protein